MTVALRRRGGMKPHVGTDHRHNDDLVLGPCDGGGIKKNGHINQNRAKPIENITVK